MADIDALPASYQVPGHGYGATEYVLVNTGTLGTASLGLNATTRVLRVPAGFTVTGLELHVGDGDSNNSPALVLALGDAGDDDRLVTASNIGQAGGVVSALRNAAGAIGLGHTYTEETDIDLKATTAAATAQATYFKIALRGRIA